MFTRMNWMLIRLFALPLLLMLLSLALLWFLGWSVPHMFSSTLLAGLGEQSARLALPACWLATGAATVTALYRTFQLWRWQQGKTDACRSCGGMVVVRDGRYGLYSRCLACGETRSIR